MALQGAIRGFKASCFWYSFQVLFGGLIAHDVLGQRCLLVFYRERASFIASAESDCAFFEEHVL
jgi:hypothetical protein